MFCPNCGTNLPDNARFCGQCGTTLDTEPAPQPEYQQPAYEEPVRQTTAYQYEQAYTQTACKPSKPAKRGNLITSIFRPQTRALALVSAIAFLLCIGLAVYGYFTIKNISLTEMPAFTAMEEISGESFDIEKMLEEAGFDEADLDEYFDQARDALDETELSKKERKALEELLTSVEDLLNTPSLGNLQSTVNSMDNTVDLLEDVQDDLERQVKKSNLSAETRENCYAALDALDSVMEAYDEVSKITEVVEIIDLVLLGLLIFALVFIALAGLFRLPGLLILSMLFYCPAVFALGSTAIGGAAFVVHIVLWVLLAMVNSKHRATRYE